MFEPSTYDQYQNLIFQMKSDRQLSERESKGHLPPEKEAIPSNIPIIKPKSDRSIERQSKQIKRQALAQSKGKLITSRAASPANRSIKHELTPARELGKMAQSKYTAFPQGGTTAALAANLIRQRPTSGSPPRTQLEPRRSAVVRVHSPVASSQPVLLPGHITTTQTITIPQVVSTQSIQVSPTIVHSQQILTPPIISSNLIYGTQSTPSPNLYQSQMNLANSTRTQQILTQKQQIVRRYRQTLQDRQGRLKNYQARLSNMQQKLQDHDLQRKANVILTNYFTQLSRLFSNQQLSLQQLRAFIVKLIEQNTRLRQQIQQNQLQYRERQQHLTEQLQRLINRNTQTAFQNNKVQLGTYQLTRQLNQKNREIDILRQKIRELSEMERGAKGNNMSKVELDIEVKKLRSINTGLQNQLNLLRTRVTQAEMSPQSDKFHINGSHKNLFENSSQNNIFQSNQSENNALRAKIMSLQVKLESRNQQILALGQRLHAMEQQKHGTHYGRGNDSLSYSLEGGVDRLDINQSNIRRVRQDQNTNSSALRLIHSLGRGQEQSGSQTHSSRLSSQRNRPSNFQGQAISGKPQAISIIQEGQRPQSHYNLLPPSQLEPIHQNSSRTDEPSTLHDRQKALLATAQQLRQRIIELENQNGYTMQRLQAQISASGDRQQLSRKNQELKQAKLKLQLHIIELEKDAAETETKIREMWEMHKRQIQQERQKGRVLLENSKQKQMILRVRIEQLQQIVGRLQNQQVHQIRQLSKQRSITGQVANRYGQMEAQINKLQQYKVHCGELQDKMEGVVQTNEELRKEIISKQSQLDILKQRLESLSTAKKLVQEALARKERNNSVTMPLNEALQLNSSVRASSKPAEQGQQHEQLLKSYREQLSDLTERVNLLNVENTRLRSIQQTNKIDVQTLRRHLGQTGTQIDSLIKELEEARSQGLRVTQLQLQLEELKSGEVKKKLQMRLKNRQSLASPNDKNEQEEQHQSVDIEKELMKQQTARQNLLQDIQVLTQQLKFAQKEIANRQATQQRLKEEMKDTISRLERQCQIYKQSAESVMPLIDQNNQLKIELSESKRQKPQSNVQIFANHQNQQRQLLSSQHVNIQKLQASVKRLQQQKQLLQQKLKAAASQMEILRQAQNNFHNAQAQFMNKQNHIVRSHEQKAKILLQQLQNAQEQAMRLRKNESQSQQNMSQVAEANRRNLQTVNRHQQQLNTKMQMKEQQINIYRDKLEKAQKTRSEIQSKINKIEQQAAYNESQLKTKIEDLIRINSQLSNHKAAESEKYMQQLNQERANRLQAIKDIQQGLYKQQAQKMMKLQQQSTEEMTQLRRDLINKTNELSKQKSERQRLDLAIRRMQQVVQDHSRSTQMRLREVQINQSKEISRITQILQNQKLRQIENIQSNFVQKHEKQLQSMQQQYQQHFQNHMNGVMTQHQQEMDQLQSQHITQLNQLQSKLAEKQSEILKITNILQQNRHQLNKITTQSTNTKSQSISQQNMIKEQLVKAMQQISVLQHQLTQSQNTLKQSTQQQLKQYQQQYTQLQTEHSHCRQQHTQLQSQLHNYQQKYNQLQTQHNQLQAQLHRSKQQHTQLQTQLNTLQSQLNTLQSQHNQLKSQHTQLQSQLHQSHLQSNQIRQEHDNHQQEYSQLQAQHSHCQQQHNQLQQQLHHYQQQHNQLQQQLHRIQQHYHQVQQQLRQYEQQYNQLQSQHTQLQSQFHQRQHTSLQHYQQQYNQLHSQQTSLQQQLHHYQQQHHKLHSQLQHFNQLQSQIQQLNIQFNKLKQSNTALHSQLQHSKQQNILLQQHLNTSNTHNTTLKNTNDQLTQQSHNLQSTISQLKQQIHHVQQNSRVQLETEINKIVEVKTHQARTSQQQIDRQNSVLRKELKQLQEYNMQLERNCQQLRLDIERLQNDQRGIVELKEQLTMELQRVNKELETSNRPIQTTIKQKQLANKQLQIAIKELETVNKQKQFTNRQLQNTSRQLQSVNNQLQSTTNQLQSANTSLQSTTAQLQSVTKQLQKTHTQSLNWQQQSNNLSQQLNQLLQQKAFLHQSIVKFKQQGIQIQKQLNQQQQQSAQLRKQLMKVQQNSIIHQEQVVKTHSQTQNIKQQYDKLHILSNTLQQQLNKSQNQKSFLQQQLVKTKQQSLQLQQQLSRIQNQSIAIQQEMTKIQQQAIIFQQQAINSQNQTNLLKQEQAKVQQINQQLTQQLQKAHQDHHGTKIQLNTLSSNHQQLSISHQQLANRLQQLQSLSTQLRNVNMTLVKQNQHTQHKFNQGRQAVSRLQSMFRQVETEQLNKIAQLELFLDTMKRNQSLLVSRLQQLQAQIINKQQIIRHKEEQQHRHLNHITQLQSTIQNAVFGNKQSQQQLRQHIAGLEQELQQIHQTSQKQHVKQLEMLRQNEYNIQHTVQQLQQKYAKSLRDKEDIEQHFTSMLDKMKKLEIDKNNLAMELNKKTAYCLEIEEDIGKTNQKIEQLHMMYENEKRQMMERVEEERINQTNNYHNQYDMVVERLKNSEKLVMELERQNQEIRHLKDQTKESSMHNSEMIQMKMQQEIDSLRYQLVRQQDGVRQRQQQGLHGTRQQTTSQNTTTQQTTSQSTATIHTTNDQDLIKQRDLLKQQLIKTQQQCINLRQKLTEVQQQLSQSSRHTITLTSKLQSFEISQLEQTTVKNHIRQMHQKLLISARDLTEARMEIDHLKKQSIANDQTDKLLKQLSNLQQEYRNLECYTQEQSREVQYLKQENQRLNEMVSQLDQMLKEIHNLKTEGDKMQQMVQEIAQLRQQNQNAVNLIRMKEEQLKQSRFQIDRFKTQMDRLKTQNDQLNHLSQQQRNQINNFTEMHKHNDHEIQQVRNGSMSHDLSLSNSQDHRLQASYVAPIQVQPVSPFRNESLRRWTAQFGTEELQQMLSHGINSAIAHNSESSGDSIVGQLQNIPQTIKVISSQALPQPSFGTIKYTHSEMINAQQLPASNQRFSSTSIINNKPKTITIEEHEAIVNEMQNRLNEEMAKVMRFTEETDILRRDLEKAWVQAQKNNQLQTTIQNLQNQINNMKMAKSLDSHPAVRQVTSIRDLPRFSNQHSVHNFQSGIAVHITVRDLQQQIGRLKTELNRKHGSSMTFNGDEAVQAKLNRLIEESQSQKRIHDEAYSSLELSNQNLERQLQETRRHLKQMHQRVVNGQLSSNQEQIKAKQQIQRLIGQLERKTAHIVELQGIVRRLTQENEHLRRQHDKEMNNMLQIQRQKSHKIQHQLDNLRHQQQMLMLDHRLKTQSLVNHQRQVNRLRREMDGLTEIQHNMSQSDRKKVLNLEQDNLRMKLELQMKESQVNSLRQRQRSKNYSVNDQINTLRDQANQLSHKNRQLQWANQDLKNEIERMSQERMSQWRSYDTTNDNSLQQSLHHLRHNLTQKQRQLINLKDQMNMAKRNLDFQKIQWADQLKALKQIGLDLQKQNSQLLQKNQQLESRLRESQNDSIHKKTIDGNPRSEQFKKQLDDILNEMQNKGMAGPIKKRMSEGAEITTELQPKKPRILDKKEDEYFQNPFDDFTQVTDARQKSITPRNKNTFSFMNLQHEQISSQSQMTPNNNAIIIPHKPMTAHSLHNPSGGTIEIKNKPQLVIKSNQINVFDGRPPMSNRATASQKGSRVIQKLADDPSQIKKQGSLSGSQNNIQFIRVTELSRQKLDGSSNSIGSPQGGQVVSPRSSQGPTHFVKRSVILGKEGSVNGSVRHLAPQNPTVLSTSTERKITTARSLLPDVTDTPYFTKGSTTSIKEQAVSRQHSHSPSHSTPNMFQAMKSENGSVSKLHVGTHQNIIGQQQLQNNQQQIQQIPQSSQTQQMQQIQSTQQTKITTQQLTPALQPQIQPKPNNQMTPINQIKQSQASVKSQTFKTLGPIQQAIISQSSIGMHQTSQSTFGQPITTLTSIPQTAIFQSPTLINLPVKDQSKRTSRFITEQQALTTNIVTTTVARQQPLSSDVDFSITASRSSSQSSLPGMNVLQQHYDPNAPKDCCQVQDCCAQSN